MQEDFLSRCDDVVTRKFYLYSESGDERVIDCELHQFMAVLELVRDICPEDCLAYADPLD